MEVNKTQQYTYKDIINAVGRMDEESRGILLEVMKVNDLLYIINNEESFEQYQNTLNSYIALYQNVAQILYDVKELIAKPEETKDILTEYDELSEYEKINTTLKLLNKPNFQKDVAKILISDYKRIKESDSTIRALDNLFGFGKYMDELIARGVGCNHQYGISGLSHE